ncbi:SMI1/KNR4 family protein [Kitasatospora sp. NPDC051914]|uniref:SMI1/KNR4 family protein n=1 Tax=Kitasatospora sp. NPDC051914 TaxID=3154945 RepID=UPI003439BA34
MTEQVERGVQRIAEKITAGAPAGWAEAVLVSVQGQYGLHLSGRYTAAGAHPKLMHVPGAFADLKEVTEAVGAARGWDSTRLEFRCRPSGEFAMTASRDTVSELHGARAGFQAVLDHGYRLSQPGLAQDEGTAAAAGDPDLAVARLRDHLQRRAGILGRAETLPPPVTTAELDDAERRIGRPLPADLRAMYLVADGSGDDAPGLFGNLGWMPLARLVAANADLREPVWSGWENSWDTVVLDADPPDTVRRCHGHPAWLPFATADDGNYLAVDMSPAPAGRRGQVIQIGRDYSDGPVYVADSVTSLLGRYLELLDRGAYAVEEDDPDFIDFLETPSDPCPEYELLADGIPHDVPATLQAVLIQFRAPTDPMDLTPLTAATRLRRLELKQRPTTDLTPLRALPVEALTVTLDGGDLAPLEGHRHLAFLDLATGTPVDITPLRTVPNLRCLDLSQADVRNLAVLADLPDLRYLALNGQQWTDLLDQGKLPTTLAAARLAGTGVSRDEALIWAERLGLDGGEPLHMTGTLAPGHSA